MLEKETELFGLEKVATSPKIIGISLFLFLRTLLREESRSLPGILPRCQSGAAHRRQDVPAECHATGADTEGRRLAFFGVGAPLFGGFKGETKRKPDHFGGGGPNLKKTYSLEEDWPESQHSGFPHREGSIISKDSWPTCWK